MTEAQKKIKKSRIRAIDNGTRYDVGGSVIGIGRKIQNDEHGDVRDVVLVFKGRGKKGGEFVRTYHFGAGSIPEALFILEAGKNDIVS